MLRMILLLAFAHQLFAYKVYVTDSETASIYVIDTTTNAVIATVDNPFTPFINLTELAVTPDQQTIYATDSASDTVYVISTTTETVTTTVANATSNPFAFLQGVVIAPDGQTAYVTDANGASSTVFVIDVPSNTATSFLPIMNLIQPLHPAISSNGQFLYIPDTITHLLTIVNGVNSSQQNLAHQLLTAVWTPQPSIFVTALGAVFVGPGNELNPPLTLVTGASPPFQNPFWAAATPNGQFVYVSDADSAQVYVISTTSNTVVGTVGGQSFIEPTGIAFTPDGQFGYVADAGLSAVYVFSTATNQVVTKVSTTGFPSFVFPFAMTIAGSTPQRAFHRPNNRRL